MFWGQRESGRAWRTNLASRTKVIFTPSKEELRAQYIYIYRGTCTRGAVPILYCSRKTRDKEYSGAMWVRCVFETMPASANVRFVDGQKRIGVRGTKCKLCVEHTYYNTIECVRTIASICVFGYILVILYCGQCLCARALLRNKFNCPRVLVVYSSRDARHSVRLARI